MVALRRRRSPQGRAKPRRHRWLIVVVTAALLCALLALALTRISLGELGHAILNVNVVWLGVAFVLTAVSNLARAESWFSLIAAAAPGRIVGRMPVARSLLIGAAASSVAPGRLGEAARAWLVARRLGAAREWLPTVAGTILAQTFVNLLALLILVLVALSASTIRDARAGAAGVAVALPVAILALLVCGPRLAQSASVRRDAPLGRFAGWSAERLIEVRDGLKAFRRPRTAAHASASQLMAWVLQLGCCYAVILATGLQQWAGLGAAAAVLLAVNLTSILPLTPSNVGIYQAACIAVLVPFGVTAPHGLAYGVILQAVEVFSGLALGLPALAREGLSLSELQQQATRAPIHDAAQAH